VRREDEEKTLTTGRSRNHSSNLGSPYFGNELGKTYYKIRLGMTEGTILTYRRHLC